MQRIRDFSGVLILLVSIFHLSACTPGETTLATTIAGNKLTESIDKIGWSLDRAAANSDYLLEKNLRTIQLLSNTLSQDLQVEIGKNRKFVSAELGENITKLSELIEQAQGGILEIENFMHLDVQSIANQLPFKPDSFLVKSVEGYGVMFRTSGSYDFRIIGNAFQPGHLYKVKINNNIVDPANIFGGGQANVLQFSIPVSAINDLFDDKKVTRIPLQVQSFLKSGDKDSFYKFTSEILLLPKLPVTYELNENYRKLTWDDPKQNYEFIKPMGPTGRNGVWHSHSLSGSITDPNTRITGILSQGTDGSHSYCRNAKILNGGKNISADCANQCHDCTRNGKVMVELSTKLYIESTKSLYFSNDTSQKSLLGYGTHTARLDENTQAWMLKVRYFNGRVISLHSKKLSEFGARVFIENDENSGFGRLILEITDPLFT